MFSIVASLHVLLGVNQKKLLQSTPSEDWLLIRENTNMEINYKDSRTKNMFLATKKICQNISQVHKSMFLQVSIPLNYFHPTIPQKYILPFMCPEKLGGEGTRILKLKKKFRQKLQVSELWLNDWLCQFQRPLKDKPYLTKCILPLKICFYLKVSPSFFT